MNRFTQARPSPCGQDGVELTAVRWKQKDYPKRPCQSGSTLRCATVASPGVGICRAKTSRIYETAERASTPGSVQPGGFSPSFFGGYVRSLPHRPTMSFFFAILYFLSPSHCTHTQSCCCCCCFAMPGSLPSFTLNDILG